MYTISYQKWYNRGYYNRAQIMDMEETLRERHKKRGDANECSFFWLHLKPYESDHVINTDNKSVQQIVDEMKAIIDNEGNE